MNTQKTFIRYTFCIISSIACTCAQAALNDVLPADYFPLAEGSTTLAAYTYDRQAQGPYSKGKKLLNGNIDTQIVALRLAHSLLLGDIPVALLSTLPWSQNTVAPTQLAGLLGAGARGTGDLRLGVTGWLLNHRDSGDYLGITGILFVPSGVYNSQQAFNVGENRYKYTLNAGWIHPLGGSYILELLPELAWFGDNGAYVGGHTLSQKNAQALTGYLRYRATANWQFHLGAQLNRGGATRIDNVAQNNPSDNNRQMLGATFLTDDKKNQWLFRVARDTEVKNGFSLGAELMLRFMTRF